MTVVNAWQGAASSSGFRVRAKVTGASIRLLVSIHPDISEPVAFGPVLPTADGIATLDAFGLLPSNSYWWAVEDDGVEDTQFPGTLTTFPAEGQQASFTFAAASCAGAQPETPGTGDVLAEERLSNHEVFDTIRDRGVNAGWLFFAHIGDLHYYDLGSDDHGITGGGSIENYRRCYDDVLLQPNQHRLYREVPLVYSAGGGGHDYGQPIHLARTLPGRNNEIQAWRERVPDYETANTSITAATYRSFVVGRVLFVVTDENADRDPDGTPDGPDKTKLGAAQKAWLEETLTNTEAEVLVWLSGAQWERGGSANWSRYEDERDELVTMFDQLGWLDRMVFVTGDRHALELVDGADNDWGGFPIWHFASLDCPPSEAPGPGAIGLPGNDQYGTVQVTDTGDQITLVGTGWTGASFWDSATLTVAIEPPSETDGVGEVATAQIRTRLTWLSCNLSDGALIEELPDLEGDEVSRVIGEYTSASLSLPIPSMDVPNTLPEDERLAAQALLAAKTTEPRRTMIVCVVNDVPTYAGIPLPRDLGTDAKIPLGLVSLEGYLRHRFIGDHTYNDQDVALIADGILRDAGDTNDGQGIGLIIDAPNTGVIRSREYLDIDDQSVYDGLSELMDAGLIEWTIDVDWRDGFKYRIVDKIARVRSRLGRSGSPQTIFQSATFSSEGGSSASYLLKQDYSGDRYANMLRLRGAGEGEDQLRSAPAIDQAELDSGVPIWELRESAPQGIEQQAEIDLHAERRLDRVRGGAQALEIVARWDAPGARWGVDWSMGDSVGHELKGHAHPKGLNGARRAIGFALSLRRGTIRPILQEDES